MPLISVTRLRVRSFLFLPQFLWDTIKSVRQVERSNGFLGGRLLVNAGYVFWTMTAWQDESAMKAYRTGGAHRKAMPQLLDWCDEAAVVHWIQQSAEIPMWPEAHQHMLEKGKLSKVIHPSPVQASQQIPAPEPSRIAQTLKPARQVQA
jgi:heme-degrading monooxygenase HmoA